jgi:hypothetical protein
MSDEQTDKKGIDSVNHRRYSPSIRQKHSGGKSSGFDSSHVIHCRLRLFLHVLVDGGLLNWDPSNFRNTLLVFEKSWCYNSSQRFPPVVSGKLSITIANKVHALAATRDLSGYEKHSGKDIQVNNYKWMSMWTTNLRQLAKL